MPSHQHLPDDATVVRCGEPPYQASNFLHSRCVEHAGYFGFSVQSASGVGLEKLAAWCPNGKIGLTTVGAIRSIGYDVVVTPGSGHHATVVVPKAWDVQAARNLAALFEGRSNPVPKIERHR